jgi:hypothetical protein
MQENSGFSTAMGSLPSPSLRQRMDRTAFLKVLANTFYPVLRNDGFKGSGTSLRRHDGQFHHIVHVQGSTSAASCYMNLGAHLDFLPAEGGRAFSPASFDEPSCAFRTRLEPRTGDSWIYGQTEAAGVATANEIVDAWASGGASFFSRFGSTHEARNLEQLIRESEGPDVHPYRALIGARIAAHIGQRQRSLTIASLAAERIGERAVVLRAMLNDFVLEVGT